MKSDSTIEGAYLVNLGVFSDYRGEVRKLVSESTSTLVQGDFVARDQYFSYSTKGVFRGLHAQAKPDSASRIITPVLGTIVDVLLDLRVSSSSFGRTDSFVVSPEDDFSIFIPPGVAHGYGCLSETAAVVSSSTADYRPELEFGVSCQGLDFYWPLGDPILSEKDKNLPKLESLDIDLLIECFSD